MIFKHRRLLTLSVLTVLCTLLSQVLSANAITLLLPIAGLLSLLCLLFSRKRRRLLDFSLALLLLSLALLSSLFVISKHEALTAREGECEVTLTLQEIISQDGEKTVAEAELNGETQARVRVVAHGTWQAGDVLVGVATLTPSERDSYLFSQGMLATVRLNECRRVASVTSIRITLGRWRSALAARMQEALPGEEGALLCALLLGVREGISDTFTRDMTRIGTIHMLSLSGMHFVILSAALMAILERTRLPRRLRTAFLGGFALFFMVFTGLSASVMRACFMLIFSLLPSLLREEKDSLSSLAAAVAFICLIEPFTARDISLWLSALSVLGILLFFDRRRRRQESTDGKFSRLLSYLLFSLSVTLSATVAVLPLTLVFFGQLPLISPIANLLLAPLMQIAIYFAILVAALGKTEIIVWISHLICKLIFTITDFLAQIKGSVLPASEGAVPVILILFFALVMGYYLFCPRRRFRATVPLSLLLATAISVGGVTVYDRACAEHELRVRAVSSASGDVLLFSSSGEELLVPVTDAGAVADEQTLFIAVGSELDGVLLPFYTRESSDYLKSLLSQCRVFRLYLPVSQTGNDRAVYLEILTLAAENGIPTTAYASDQSISVGGAALSRFSTLPSAASPRLFFEAHYLGARLHYYSSGRLDALLLSFLPDADVLFFGTYGGTPPVKYPGEVPVRSGAEIYATSPVTYPFTVTDGVVFSTALHFALRAKHPSP